MMSCVARAPKLSVCAFSLFVAIGTSAAPRARAQAEAPPASSAPSEPSTAPEQAKVPALRLESGAPRPPVQSVGVPREPTPPPGVPQAPVVKVGGGVILAYFHPYGIAEDARRQGVPTRKPNFETWRASLLLDSKVARFGVHLDLRVRDKRVRSFYDGTSWIEEAYASADLVTAGGPLGPLTLKVGKVYAQFGRFFDNQFYGSFGLRDGFKLDPNYGLSLEGVLGARRRFGARYFAQYFVIDGGSNTAIEGRDTTSNPAPYSGFPNGLARKRDMVVGRIEPFVQVDPKTSFRLGLSAQRFRADFGPTLAHQEVRRVAADVSADVYWFSAWAEYTIQQGRATLISPYAPAPAVDMATDMYGRPSSPARPGRSSDDIRYLNVGGRFTYSRVSLRYHFSSADYRDVTYPTADIPGASLPKVLVRETIHTPGISIVVSPQISLWIEHPIFQRHMDGGRLVLPASAGGSRNLPSLDLLLDKQVVVTLHGTI